MSDFNPLASENVLPADRRPEPNPLLNEAVNDNALDIAAAAGAQNAAEVADLGTLYPALSEDDLSQITILTPGTPLEPGATYLDLRTPGSQFAANEGMEATADHLYVAKDTLSPALWEKIMHITS